VEDLRRSGWDLGGRWFSAPIYPPTNDERVFGYAAGTCPNAERLATQMLNLPTHPLVTAGVARRLTAVLRGAIGA
jgi:hypothetical protein